MAAGGWSGNSMAESLKLNVRSAGVSMRGNMTDQEHAGWYSLSVSIMILLESGVSAEKIQEKVGSIASVLLNKDE